jgi:acetolactate synthase-1/2/3 large subunit
VLVDVPKDVSERRNVILNIRRALVMRSYNPVTKGHGGQIKKAAAVADRCQTADDLYAGGGVILADAADRLAKLVRALGFPMTNTLMGLGGYPATDQVVRWVCWACMAPIEANMAMQNSDVLIGDRCTL